MAMTLINQLISSWWCRTSLF